MSDRFGLFSSQGVKYRRVLYAACALLCLANICTALYSNNLTTEVNATFETRVLFHLDRKNLSSFNITILYKWEVSEGVQFDGFLYKVVDRDERSTQIHNLNNHHGIKLPNINTITARDPCMKVSKEILWVIKDNIEINCTISCLEHLDGSFESDELCNLLDDGFRSLKKSQRILAHRYVKFGRMYDLEIMPYRGRIVGESFVLPEMKPQFCREKLISEWNIPFDRADNFCRHEQNISDMTLASGPPTSMQQISIKRDLVTKKAQIKFTWKKPYDISWRVQLTAFDILVEGGTPDPLRINAAAHDKNLTYTVTISGILFGINGTILVTPRLGCNIKRFPCSDYGANVSDTFFVHDVDVCENNFDWNPYCDSNSNCIDLPAGNTKPALCSCPSGMHGNGISEVYPGGTGCTKYDSCSRRNGCHSDALCTNMSTPNATDVCVCPPSFIGDGRTAGTGCTRLSVVLGFGIGIPLVVVVAIAICTAMWRSKVNRNKVIELALSKFVVKEKHDAFISEQSDCLENGSREIDQSSIELHEIIGRGNFGVVYKAVMNSSAGTTEVAVKSCGETNDESDKKYLIGEISIMATVGLHENVMSMIGYCTNNGRSIYMVMKLMKYGDLLHFLWEARDAEKACEDPTYDLTESKACEIGRQCANGLNYLTKLKILHGDVAARNVLVDEGLHCKISDFGLANDVYQYGMIVGAKENKVPLKWVSPERMLAGMAPITWRSDVWSFGVMLYEIITLGASPHPGIPSNQLFLRLKAGERMTRPASCSQSLYSIMLWCWNWKPSKRPSFNELACEMKSSVSELGASQSLASMISIVGCDDGEQSHVVD